MGAKRVKIEMIKKNITQKELAQRLGISLPHLNLIINGKRKTPWIQQAIAEILGVSREELFSEENNENPNSLV